MNENICAISTALGVGAISIVRATGPDVIEIVNSIFKGKNLTKVDSHTINYGFIMDGENPVDEVLVSVMRAPKTFTKEDMVEINSHGGIATTNKVLELLLINGCRLAEPGEFTKKAFLNGRIDLIEAEGINDLIVSETDEARKYAMSRVEGNLSILVKSMRKRIMSLIGELEVHFDYPDEVDDDEITNNNLLKELNIVKDELEKLVKSSQEGSIIKNGIDVTLVGKPNVGKSSILNKLLNKEKAIVTDIAGTTRDIVEGSVEIDGIKINLIDTAGIRETDDIVEKIGVDKSIKTLDDADLAIMVIDGVNGITDEDINFINNANVKKIVFINKNDQDINVDTSLIKDVPIIYGNTVDVDGLDELKKTISDMFKFNEIKSKNYNFLSNAREISLVKRSLSAVNKAIESVQMEVPYEMISGDLKTSYDLLGEIIGETYQEDILDEIFSKFCVGK